MKPRITISKNRKGEIEIFLNEPGRDLLVHYLKMLSETNDHIHLGSQEDESTEIPLQTMAYNANDEFLTWGKILFRPDKWDVEYFPHAFREPEVPYA